MRSHSGCEYFVPASCSPVRTDDYLLMTMQVRGSPPGKTALTRSHSGCGYFVLASCSPARTDEKPSGDERMLRGGCRARKG